MISYVRTFVEVICRALQTWKQPNIHQLGNKQIVIHPCNEILASNKRKHPLDKLSNMQEAHAHYTRSTKAGWKRCTLTQCHLHDALQRQAEGQKPDQCSPCEAGNCSALRMHRWVHDRTHALVPT